MSDHSDSPRDSKRIPLVRRIQLKFDRFSGFISEYVANVSPGGIFIRTAAPEAPGQILEFEFRLGDGFELIKGRGEVVWARSSDQGPDRPAGMGVRFLQLSPGSRELIYKIVDDYIQRGGTPFDIVDVPEPPAREPSPAARPVSPTVPPAPAVRASGAPPTPAVASSPRAPQPPVALLAATARPPAPAPPAPAPPATQAKQAPGARGTPGDSDPWLRMAATLPPLEALVPAAPAAVPPPTFAVLNAEPQAPPPRRWLWVLLAVVVVVTLAGFLLRDNLLRWAGLEDDVAIGSGSRHPEPGPHTSRPAASGRAAGLAFRTAAGAAPTAPATAVAPGAPPPRALPAGPAASTRPAQEPGAPASPAPPLRAATATAGGPPGAATSLAGSTPAALTALEKVTWESSPTGTDVILWGNGVFLPDSFHSFRLAGPLPRAVIRVTGVKQPFSVPRLVVGTPQLRQVRIGYHVDAGGNALHIVLDLDNRGVEVVDLQANGPQLRIRLKSK